MKTEQTVSEYLFSLGSESLLSELADNTEYWWKANAFVQANYNKPVKELSTGQFNWLAKIRDGLIDEASK